jgi:hypothetical protein
MEQPMNSWNDDRLDELSSRVDEGFRRVDEGFKETATRESVAEVNARFDRLEGRMDDRFDRLTGRIDRFYYTFIVVLVALMGNFIANGA